MEVRHWWQTVMVCCGLLAGCTQPKEEYRTFTDGTDDDAAPAQIAPPTQVSEAADSAESVSPPPVVQESPTPVVAQTSVPTAVIEVRPPHAPLPIRIANLAGSASAAAPAATGPLEIKLLIPEKEFSRVDAGRSLRVSYDDLDLLKVLNMEPVPADCATHFPDWLKALDGVQVRIKGFMIPPPRESGLPGFTLARDNQICCFGRDPKVYDVIPVFLKDGTTTDYIPNRPFDVVGRFHIRPDVYRGELQNLYEIEEAEVFTN